ncbi:MAG TPA: lytic transglycosylase [Betaproteobacteria bacterium]|nr:lytic transglycosylase [Betaproteobacteria bacterium]
MRFGSIFIVGIIALFPAVAGANTILDDLAAIHSPSTPAARPAPPRENSDNVVFNKKHVLDVSSCRANFLTPLAGNAPFQHAPIRMTGNVWSRIREGFALPAMNSPLVRKNEAWYADRPEYMARMVERSQRYLYYIVNEVEKRGMPTEIALLPMVESAYNPTAYSHSHAAGLWQFTPATGRTFGLRQTGWYDGRRDIVAATDAALDYLQKLHGMFGNWALALAAYNWGEGAVSRAIARNQAKGLPTDFLSLKLPAETRNYVPRLIAVRNIVLNPARFGIKLAAIPDRPYFTEVVARHHIDVRLAARLAEVPVKELRSLNPGYKGPVIHSSKPTPLLLPVGKAKVFAENLQSYSKPLTSWRAYRPWRGEKLYRIAEKFHLSLARLKTANHISRRRRHASGRMLLVPLRHARHTRYRSPIFSYRTHTVRPGDSLYAIARHYGTTVNALMAWNHLRSSRLKPGQRLATFGPAAGAPRPTLARASSRHRRNARRPVRRTRYTIRQGDTLSSIAQRFNVAVNDIRRWNKVSPRHLRPGRKVTIYAADGDS